MSYCDILVGGKNLAYLFERLKKNNIDILKVERIDENRIILRVSKKDYQKVFAILDKTWYNKLIKKGGFFGLGEKVKSRIYFFIGLILFLIGCFYCKNLIFSVDIIGIGAKHELSLRNNLTEYGIEKFCNFNSLDTEQIKENILTDFENVSFVTLEKSGNRLVIRVFESPKNDNVNDLNKKSLLSTVSGRLVRLNVYSGTQTKNIGDSVIAGEELILGKVYTDSGEFETQALGYAVLESNYIYEKTFEDGNYSKTNVLNEAKFYCPCVDFENITFCEIVEKPLSNGVHITVTVNYLVEIGG